MHRATAFRGAPSKRCLARLLSAATPSLFFLGDPLARAMKQIPLSLGPDPAFGFDNFIEGANTQVIAALRDAAWPAGPVYLWGPAGSGKTHLLHAAAHRMADQGAAVLWAGAQRDLPWGWPESSASQQTRLVVIDDCQALDTDQQQAAFALFVTGTEPGCHIIAAGRQPPTDLPLREDLRSRLGWGLVYQTQALTDDAVRAVLQQEATRRGVPLGDEVMRYLQTRFARDLKSLMALLDRLDQFSLAQKRAVTVPLLKQMLSESAA